MNVIGISVKALVILGLCILLCGPAFSMYKNVEVSARIAELTTRTHWNQLLVMCRANRPRSVRLGLV
jgi:hypothetical protein